jgi:hypothetical protein
VAQVVRSLYSKSWRLPAEYYSFVVGPAQFFAIDGNDISERQKQWLVHALETSTARWKVV